MFMVEISMVNGAMNKLAGVTHHLATACHFMHVPGRIRDLVVYTRRLLQLGLGGLGKDP